MNSAGTLRNTVSPALRRVIPDCYDDEFERWALEMSGWTDYSWDNHPEDDENLMRNEFSRLSYTPTYEQHCQQPFEPAKTALLETQKKARDASGYYSSALGLTGVESLPFNSYTSTLDSVAFEDRLHTPESIQTGPFPIHSRTSLPMVINPQEHIASAIAPAMLSGSFSTSSLNSPQARLSVPSVSPTPVSTPLYAASSGTFTPYSPSPTPVLSPSGSSVCSLDDMEMVQALSLFDNTQLQANAMKTKTFEANDQICFRQPEGYPFPRVASPWIVSTASKPDHTIVPSPVQEIRVPTPEVSNSLGYPLPTTPKSTMKSKRNTTSRSKRTSKPRKRQIALKNQARQSRSSYRSTASKLVCDVCPYVQEPVEGHRRSFKRHLEKHPKYKVYEWRCRGILQPDGTYAGGCNNLFARRDALLRHIKTSAECISEVIPVEYIRGNHSEMDEM